jgi:hypothetical protein
MKRSWVSVEPESPAETFPIAGQAIANQEENRCAVILQGVIVANVEVTRSEVSRHTAIITVDLCFGACFTSTMDHFL